MSAKKHVSIDRGAGLTGAVLAILGVFHVAERLGITADELAIVIGALGTIGAEVRHRMESRKGAPEETPEETPEPGDTLDEVLPADDGGEG
jgi:hypothetical protein